MSSRVLVTGASSSAAASVLPAAAAAGAVVYAADSNLYAPGLFFVDARNRAHLPEPDEPEMIPELLAFCVSREIDVVIPTLDDELLELAVMRERFRALGIHLMLSSSDAIQAAIDPWRLFELCRDRVPVPRVALFDQRFDAREWRPPLTLRRRDGRDQRTIVARRELELYARSDAWMVQEALPGNMYEVDVLRLASGSVVATVPREVLVSAKGVAVTSRTFHDAGLEAMAATVVETLGLAHLVCVQFARGVDGQVRLNAVEPRVPSSIAVSLAAGTDLVGGALHDLLGYPYEPVNDFQEVGVVRASGTQLVPEAEIRSAQNAPWPLGRPLHPTVVQ